MTEDTLKKIEKIIEIAESIKTVPKEWPQAGDRYYFNMSINVEYDIFRNDGVDRWRQISGNFFKTKNEAKNYRALLKTQAELRAMADYVKPWPDGKISYITWSRNLASFIVLELSKHELALFGWSSEERAQAVIDKIGQDRLKAMRQAGLST